MTTIRLTFPWGRYYAHPWGINPTRLREPEWPPSPWRLLRALLSAWFRAHPGQVPSTDCVALIESLGRELPEIGFVKVSFGQTVHWQPNYGAAGTENRADATYKNTRHENHFAAVHGPVFLRWRNVTLTAQHRYLLEDLLAELSYFGRAESLCQAELDDGEPGMETGWCLPTDGRKISSACRDVFCPKPNDFQFSDLWMRREHLPNHDQHNAPPHFVDTLLSSTLQADGAEWRSYQMPDDWPHQRLVRTPRQIRVSQRDTDWKPVAKTLTFSLQSRVPLPLKCMVDLADRFRASAIKQFKVAQGHDAGSFALTGHGRPPGDVQGRHQHAHYLPVATTSSNELRSIVIYAPCGFTRAEVNALMAVRSLRWGASRYPIKPVLLETSDSEPSFLQGNPSRKWRSMTPFVPQGHFFRGKLSDGKPKANRSPEEQLVMALRQSGIAAGVVVKRLALGGSAQDGVPPLPQWDIVRAPNDVPIFDESVSLRTRETHGNLNRRIGFYFLLEFDEAVAISKPLGHSSHFGLGLFVPCD